ncbi:MAG: PP2C family protein-serine/threonine phosphatase [Dokdonella sp.]
MTNSTTLFERLLALNAFDGDSAEALRVLHRHLAPDFPGCSLCLLRPDSNDADHARLSGMIDANGHELMANVDALGDQVSLPLFVDALATRVVSARDLAVIDLSVAEQALPLAVAMLNPATLLVVPLASAAGRMKLVLGASRPQRFAQISRDATLQSINLAASLIARSLLTRSLRAETQRQRQAIEGLAEVQRLLLPDMRAISGLDYAVHWQPADTAAGDYYDLMPLNADGDTAARPNGDTWGCLVADVSGHGAASAMEAVQFDAILRTYRGGPEDGPAGALTYANRYFFSRRQRRHFLTVMAVLYRSDQRRLIYVSAGHPPLLRRRAGMVTLHGAGEQIPLGVLRDHTWSNHELDVEAGDILVIYTDGVLEARNANGEAFGQERLIEHVRDGSDSAHTLLDELIASLMAHQGGPIGSDDQTLIVLRIE